MANRCVRLFRRSVEVQSQNQLTISSHTQIFRKTFRYSNLLIFLLKTELLGEID